MIATRCLGCLLVALTFVLLESSSQQDCDACGRDRPLLRAHCEIVAVVEPAPVLVQPPVKAIPEAEVKVDKDLGVNVMNISKLHRDGKSDSARRLAAGAAKQVQEIADLMHMFKFGSKGGLKFRIQRTAAQPKPGLDSQIRDLMSGPAPKIVANPAANEEAGFMIAAMAEIMITMGPSKERGKKTKAAWIQHATELRAAGFEFGNAEVANDPNALKVVAARINASCNGCHILFK